MPEHDPSISASKFIASLVKSLQIICNGHVEFNESIELVGHINVKIDHRLKFNYIVDENVSKEGEDCSTTFLSNSYYSSPPSLHKDDQHSQQDTDLSLTSLSSDPCKSHTSMKLSGSESRWLNENRPRDSNHHMFSVNENRPKEIPSQIFSLNENRPRDSQSHIFPVNETRLRESPSQMFSVNVKSLKPQDNPIAFKLESEDEQNECMMLPMSSDGFQTEVPVHEPIVPRGSGSMTDSLSGLRAQKRSRMEEDEVSGKKADDDILKDPSSINVCMENLPSSDPPADTVKGDIKLDDSIHQLKDLKELISNLTSMCKNPTIQEEVTNQMSNYCVMGTGEEMKAAKKKFLEYMDKERMMRIKEVLKMKRGKQRKLRLKALLADSGLSHEELLILAQDCSIYRKKPNWKYFPDNWQDRDGSRKLRKKSFRLKTQQRQQKLLEMVELLKRNQAADPGMTVVSKNGSKKCTLHKSSVSVVSHNTYQLTLENIDEVAEALTGKTTRALLLQKNIQDKPNEKMKAEQSRRTIIKKKMKQIVTKMLGAVADAGYRVLVTSTIGSETGSHSAELSVTPIKVDDFFPETKESEVKPELSEEEYAKQLEREQIIEKQKINEEKMKEMEGKLIRILSGAEDIFIPTRKRFGPGAPQPSDAERMKEYRKCLKSDPEKYQMYKQKRLLNKKWRKLGQLAAKIKSNTSGATLAVIPASANDEVHVSQPMATIVNINPPGVGNVNMHCQQVFEHPAPHQPTASVVNVHHTNQYVGQVSGMHATHQQPITYGNEMEFVELIAATHGVQNQHFG